MARQVFTTPSARMSQKYQTTLRYLEDSYTPLSEKEKIFLQSFIKEKTEKFNRGQWWQKIQTPSSRQLGDEFKNIMEDYHNPDDVQHEDDVLKNALEDPDFSSIENSAPNVSKKEIDRRVEDIENASYDGNTGERNAIYGTMDDASDDGTLVPTSKITRNPTSTAEFKTGELDFIPHF